jgi:hypothetical protein
VFLTQKPLRFGKRKITSQTLISCFFDYWRKNVNAPKRMSEASKEASILWKQMTQEEKAYWRKRYELIRDRGHLLEQQ